MSSVEPPSVEPVFGMPTWVSFPNRLAFGIKVDEYEKVCWIELFLRVKWFLSVKLVLLN